MATRWKKLRARPDEPGAPGMPAALPQATARVNARDPTHTAMTAKIVLIVTPIAISGLPQSALNRARAALTAWVNGLMLLRNLSQSGARAIGRRIADRSSKGMAIELTTGANASSLLSIRPPAYDNGATDSPIRTSRASTATMLPGWITRPNGMASRIMIKAWNIRTTTSRSDR